MKADVACWTLQYTRDIVLPLGRLIDRNTTTLLCRPARRTEMETVKSTSYTATDCQPVRRSVDVPEQKRLLSAAEDQSSVTTATPPTRPSSTASSLASSRVHVGPMTSVARVSRRFLAGRGRADWTRSARSPRRVDSMRASSFAAGVVRFHN